MNRIQKLDFGPRVSGYLFCGKNTDKDSPIVVVEEGSGMNVLRYGIGKDLTSGRAQKYEDYVIWLHDRRSSIEPVDMIKSIERLMREIGIRKVHGIGFSNGAATVSDAMAREPQLFTSIISAGGYAKNLVGLKTDTKAVFFCSTKGALKNFDTIGKYVNTGVPNTQAYFSQITHQALERKIMVPQSIEYLVGDWSIGYDGAALTSDGRCRGTHIYNGMKQLK